jgi:antitoxin (DNA-binding transcriptional repressor) of toxin-antitoxin stability system
LKRAIFGFILELQRLFFALSDTMTIYVNQQEAEQRFSELLSQVLQGEEIVISIQGQEMARLIPSSLPLQPRVPGIDKGRFVVPDDFDEPLSEAVIKAFEGEG